MPEDPDEFTRFREKARAQTSRRLLEEFKERVKQAVHGHGDQAQAGFWAYRPGHDFPPEAIRHPSEYDGGRHLNLACTQTDLKPSAQRKLVESWCEALPGLDKVEFLWFSSRANQPLFDAACQMKSLEGLYVSWSGIKSLNSIVRLRRLRYLYLGSSPSLASLAPLEEAAPLEWLELENIAACSDLSFLAAHPSLKGLGVSGVENKYLNVHSLAPLTHLQALEWASLRLVRIKSGGLWPLARLRRLKYLYLSNKYPMEELAALAGMRPDIQCDLFQPIAPVEYMTCKKCGTHNLVMLTGKGKPCLCPSCDEERLKRHIDAFETIRKAQKQWLKSQKP